MNRFPDLPGMWLLIFFVTPIVEMYLLIEVGGYIGALATISLVMITAVIGVALLRIQGLATLTRGMGRLQSGELPAREVVEGLLLAVAGALLLTPGFVTDTVGFTLLTPALRGRVAERILARVQIIQAVNTGSGGNPTHRYDQEPTEVLEGEFEPLDGSQEADPAKSDPDARS